MNSKSKVMTILALAAGASASIAVMNQYFKISASSKNLLTETEPLCFKWRLGDIYYTKKGSGKPLLLIHDLNFASSGYEWNFLIDKLSHNYTVYVIDLLGCGRSEKPNLTYTNYLYVQLLTDFVRSEIGHRTNLLVTGESCSFSIMACSTSPDLFDKLILINPNSLSAYGQIPGNHSKPYKLFLDLPILGTLFYHIASSHMMLKETFHNKYFYNPYLAKLPVIDHYFEAAHLGKCPKALFSSMECRYTNCNISNALKRIDNSLFIIGGAEEPDIYSITDEYKQCNPAIETSIIPKTKHLPQLEDPGKVLERVTMFFS